MVAVVTEAAGFIGSFLRTPLLATSLVAHQVTAAPAPRSSEPASP